MVNKRKTKQKNTPARKRRRGVATEYRFRIDAYTPDTMPMARLAEYLAELATVLGEPTSVHLVRLEPGSTVLVHEIEREAVPKVRERAISVRRGRGPRDAVRAYHAINKLLREDDGIGVLQEQTGAEIIRFPGREETEEEFAAIRQYGSIDGEVLRVGGPQKYVPVLLQSEDRQIAGCWAERAAGVSRLVLHAPVFFLRPEDFLTVGEMAAMRRASSRVSSLAAARGRACLRMIADLANHR